MVEIDCLPFETSADVTEELSSCFGEVLEDNSLDFEILYSGYMISPEHLDNKRLEDDPLLHHQGVILYYSVEAERTDYLDRVSL